MKMKKSAREKKPHKKWITMSRRRTLEAVMFLSPWLIGTCIFFVRPILTSIRLSFSEITNLHGYVMGWVGLDNYQYIFAQDITFVPTLISVVQDTLINTPMSLVFSLVIAMLINRPVAGKGFFRSCFFIPVLLGSGYVMQNLLKIDATGSVGMGIEVPGLVQGLIGTTFVTVIQSFLDRVTLVLWHSGVQILLFLAGLQGISSTLYEAAKCDGATQWEMFWKVTLPMISPIILLNFVYTMVTSFGSSDNALVEYIIDNVFLKTRFGEGAAMGWVYFLFVFVLCGAVFLVGRKLVVDEEAR